MLCEATPRRIQATSNVRGFVHPERLRVAVTGGISLSTWRVLSRTGFVCVPEGVRRGVVTPSSGQGL